MNVIKIKSIAHYVETVDSLMNGNSYVLFRGQRMQWPLLPKIGRVKLRKSLKETEKEMLASLKRRVVPLLTSKPENDLEWLALAQHHGMATRLLDWTENALAALWFTVRNCPVLNNKGIKEDGVVWCLNAKDNSVLAADDPKRDAIKPFGKKQTVVFRPRHISPRIVAQSGWFTLHAWLDKKDKFISLEQNILFKKQLTKIVVSSDIFFQLRRLLEKLNVNDATLFPDLVGLCEQIEREHTYLEDEKTPAKNRKNVSEKKLQIKVITK